jgi:hypothetical protein
VFIAVDFDGTIVQMDHAYDDLKAPLVFVPRAKEALAALKNAGHVLMLWSARSSPALLVDPKHDPLVAAGVRKIPLKQWRASLPVNLARHQQMIDFVNRELPGVFAVLNGGAQRGKPDVDLFIDDRMANPQTVGWANIERVYGERAA